eukprot:991854_1
MVSMEMAYNLPRLLMAMIQFQGDITLIMVIPRNGFGPPRNEYNLINRSARPILKRNLNILKTNSITFFRRLGTLVRMDWMKRLQKKSKQIEKNRNIARETNATKKRIFGNKTAFRRVEQVHSTKSDDNHQGTSRLMKTVRCVNMDKMMSSNISQNIMSKKPNYKKRHRKKARAGLVGKNGQVGNMSTKSWSSSESTFDPKFCRDGNDTDSDGAVSKQKNTTQPIFTKKRRVKCKNKKNPAEAIQVSVTTNIVVTNNGSSTKTKSVSSSKKKKISLRIPKKSLRNMSVNTKIINEDKSERARTKNTKCTTDASSTDDADTCTDGNPMKTDSKYPRKPIINGEQWIRHYSKPDRKYYWLLPNDSGDIIGKEWDPWRIHSEKAPWMMSKQTWGRFMDANKSQYYYNYETKESTFRRPRAFESDAEIEYDSADNSLSNIHVE